MSKPRSPSINNPSRKAKEETKAAGDFGKKRQKCPSYNEQSFNRNVLPYTTYNNNKCFQQNHISNWQQFTSKVVTKPMSTVINYCEHGEECYRQNVDHIQSCHPSKFQRISEYAPQQAIDRRCTTQTYCFGHYQKSETEQQQHLQDMYHIANKKLPLRETLKVVAKSAYLKDSLLAELINALTSKEKQQFEDQILPKIADLVLDTPKLFPKSDPLPILSQGCKMETRLTREQCACLVANMFMCTMIDQHNSNLSRRFNFSELYTRTGQICIDQVKKQKIACILNYFKHITNAPSLSGHVAFKRLHLNEEIHGQFRNIEGWKSCSELLQEVHVDRNHKIEDKKDCVEVDFANRFLGGGVLGKGALQEEIQCITRPEQLVGLLFCESMTDEEAILIQGARAYSGYKGYGKTFAFHASNMSIEDVDKEVVAMDAIDFSTTQGSQFAEPSILRELNKAYVAFYGGDLDSKTSPKKPISTGNWGCGAFQGDAQLKFLLQWIAASRAGRKLIYHSLNDAKLRGDASTILEHYRQKTVGTLVQDIMVCLQHVKQSKTKGVELFQSLKDLKRKRPAL